MVETTERAFEECRVKIANLVEDACRRMDQQLNRVARPATRSI